LGKNIAKFADLGSKKAGLSSDFWENCMILKKISIISIGKRPFFGVCYISRKITGLTYQSTLSNNNNNHKKLAYILRHKISVKIILNIHLHKVYTLQEIQGPPPPNKQSQTLLLIFHDILWF
jgi:hypothetical protein